MASAFASFILDHDPTIKQFGFDLSVAVLLAGILVVTLAPAALATFGRAAWRLPGWLDKVLPTSRSRASRSAPGAERARQNILVNRLTSEARHIYDSCVTG